MSLPASCGTVRFTAAESTLPHASSGDHYKLHRLQSDTVLRIQSLVFYALGTLLLASNARDDVPDVPDSRPTILGVTSAWHWYPITNYACLLRAYNLSRISVCWFRSSRAVPVNSTAYCDVTSCGLVEVHRHFRETYLLRLQSRNVGEFIPINTNNIPQESAVNGLFSLFQVQLLIMRFIFMRLLGDGLLWKKIWIVLKLQLFSAYSSIVVVKFVLNSQTSFYIL
jgi:hypothetical protein